MIDKYKLEGNSWIWDGELDENKQFNDAIELSLAIWDFALPFLLTCDDPIGVLQTAKDFVVDDAVNRLPMHDWVESFQTNATPKRIFELLMARQTIAD